MYSKPSPISKFGSYDVLILVKVVKIRATASTLLGRDDERIIWSDIARRAEHYLQNFIEVLSVLDYSHRNATRVGYLAWLLGSPLANLAFISEVDSEHLKKLK
jgi:hypothetical protein